MRSSFTRSSSGRAAQQLSQQNNHDALNERTYDSEHIDYCRPDYAVVPCLAHWAEVISLDPPALSQWIHGKKTTLRGVGFDSSVS